MCPSVSSASTLSFFICMAVLGTTGLFSVDTLSSLDFTDLTRAALWPHNTPPGWAKFNTPQKQWSSALLAVSWPPPPTPVFPVSPSTWLFLETCFACHHKSSLCSYNQSQCDFLPLSFRSGPSQCASRETILNHSINQAFLPQRYWFGGAHDLDCRKLRSICQMPLYPTPELWKIKMSLDVGKYSWVGRRRGRQTDATSINCNPTLKGSKAKQGRKQSPLVSFTFQYIFKDICHRWHTKAHTSIQLCTPV